MAPRIVLAMSAFFLVLIGLVMVFSASTVEAISQGDSMFYYVGKQAGFALLGLAAAFGISRIPYQVWLNRTPFLLAWGVCMIMLLLVPVVGTEILGAKRWIYIGPVSIQPTEFAKIAIVVASAKVLYEIRDGIKEGGRAAAAVCILVLLPLGFLSATQSDLGSAIVIAMGILAVMWIGEVDRRVVIALVAVALLVFIASSVSGYRAQRIAVWLNPWSDQYGDGYQMIRSFYAFSEGGLFGVGLGNSREKFLYLPEAETDFIFSIIGEELGLVGTLAVIGLFLAFLLAGLRIADRAPDGFGKMMAGGLTAMLVGQAFLNIACATGLFPTTGKPLPFISSGGSSILASLIIVGLIVSVSRGSNVLTPYERRRNNLNVIRVEHDERQGGRTQDRVSSAGEGKDASPRPSSGIALANARPARSSSSRSQGGSSRSSGSASRSGSSSKRSQRSGLESSNGCARSSRAETRLDSRERAYREDSARRGRSSRGSERSTRR